MLTADTDTYTSELFGCFKEQKAPGELSSFLNAGPLSKCLPGETRRLRMT